jgi:hypothetical protein
MKFYQDAKIGKAFGEIISIASEMKPDRFPRFIP